MVMPDYSKQIELKYSLKVKLEELRHKNIMKELKFMSDNNIIAYKKYVNNKKETL